MNSQPRLVVRLFGTPEMTFDGLPWTVWMPPRCLLLLALVAIRDDDPPSRATLAATLWPDELDTDARTNLRRHLHELQKGLPRVDGVDWIVYEGKTLRWNDDAPAWVDVRAFRRYAADPSRARDAVEAYRGELLEGAFDESIVAERERLASTHRDLLLRSIHDAREARDLPTAIDYAQRLLAVDEWREDALREWMIATYQSGDRAAALAAYDDFARRLKAEFATLPTAETTALRDAMRADLPLPHAAEDRFESELSEPARRAWNLPFVGRDEDVTRLRSIWTRAARGNGASAFLSGEAGIGKSRLAAELAATAREQGAYVLRGRTTEPETSPYQPVLEALGGGLAHLLQVPPETPWLRALASVLPAIRSALPELAPSGEPGGDGSRERLFEAIAAAIGHLARVRPLCVVLEDLHWAGPATIDLVESLARRIGALPVMLLVTYRSDESAGGHPVRALRAALVRERRAAAVPLERLDAGDVARIVESVAGRAGDRELDERVVRLSEGNPLFVAQLLESFRESGALPDEASALRSVGDAIAMRVARLDPEIRSIAAAAATAGAPFRCDVVAALGEWDEPEVLDAVGELMDRSLVGESGDGRGYAFTHALVAAAFYGEADAQTRSLRHRRVATIMENAWQPDDRAALGAIARHYELGGMPSQAAVMYVRAARAAAAIFAREEAVAAAHRAYELAADDRTRFEAMLVASSQQSSTDALQRYRADVERLERSAAALGDEERFEAMRMRERFSGQIVDYDAHLEVIEDLQALADRTGAARHQAYAVFSRGFFFMQRGDVERARELFEKALEFALETGNAEEVARIREELIGVLMRCGRWDRARAEFELQKRLVAENAVSAIRRTSVLSIECTFAALADDGPRLDRAARELLEASIRIGDDYNEAKAHMLLCQSAALDFDFQGAREHARVAREQFERVGDRRASAVSVLNLAVMEMLVGRTDRAQQLIDAERDFFAEFDPADMPASAAMYRAESLLLAERFEEALAGISSTVEASAGARELRFIDETTTLLGAAEGKCGRYDRGVEHLREAMRNSLEHEAPSQAAYAACWLIEIACDAGKPEDAQAAAAELRRLYEEHREVIARPAFACYAMARFARDRSPQEVRRWASEGAAVARERLERLRDPADAAAFRRLFFVRELLAEPAKTPT
jgi:DNA-binding SARP family transcriptional activator/tetratricopeptide (TPR) repeat protein